jgi:peroxiredoxin
MGALSRGKTAPPISLVDAGGKKQSLEVALKHGPVLAAFLKVSCPTCQFTVPFLERLYQSYAGPNFTLLGVSQDNARDTREFCEEYGVQFPVLIDEHGYPCVKRVWVDQRAIDVLDQPRQTNSNLQRRFLQGGP